MGKIFVGTPGFRGNPCAINRGQMRPMVADLVAGQVKIGFVGSIRDDGFMYGQGGLRGLGVSRT